VSTDSRITRRSFVKLCASMAAMVISAPQILAREKGVSHRYDRVQLVDDRDKPIRLSNLNVGENYIFHYPFVCTPCFLLNLGEPAAPGTSLRTEDGRAYKWQGGVGPQRSVVAFSAICSHRMTYPARQVSFISYRHQTTAFLDKQDETVRRPQVIYCCSEKSVYDPAQGARVLGGPAPQPLAAVLLEYDKNNDALYATGAYGGELFDQFMEKFAFHLALEYQTDDIQKRVSGTTSVVPLDRYSATRVRC
jgi:arsenite oxidase small subunit